MSTMIHIRNFSYAVNGVRILEDVSLEVAAGEFLSIIGPNGAGKTTLIKCLVRINPGGKEEISIGNRPLSSYGSKALARLVGYVPQGDNRELPFTVEEFVFMGRYPYQGPFTAVSAEDRRAVREALELTGSSRFAKRSLDTLSGGERQGVFIAAALAQDARILLLDEPTAFLDPKHVADIHAILRRVNREKGITVVMVTHDINGAAMLSDRIAVLKQGRVATVGRPEDIMTNIVLEHIYDKPFLFVTHPVTGQRLIVPEGVTP
ncbi:MAG: ABC transporter ATP-binding protein [Candidatus Latescibacterota bacterium]